MRRVLAGENVSLIKPKWHPTPVQLPGAPQRTSEPVSAAQGYLPQDYENLNTAYGSEADLRRCVAALKRRGLKALADVVVNHRCAQQQVCAAPNAVSAQPKGVVRMHRLTE